MMRSCHQWNVCITVKSIVRVEMMRSCHLWNVCITVKSIVRVEMMRSCHLWNVCITVKSIVRVEMMRSCHLWNGCITVKSIEIVEMTRVVTCGMDGKHIRNKRVEWVEMTAKVDQSLASSLSQTLTKERWICESYVLSCLGGKRLCIFVEQAALKILNPCQSIYNCFAVSVADPRYLSRIRIFASRILDHGSGFKSKNFSIFNPKNCF